MKKVFAIVVLAATLFTVNTSFPAVISADEVSVSQEAIINSQWAALYNYVCSLTEDGSLPDFWAGGAVIDDYSNMEIFVTCAPDEIRDDIIRVTGNDNFKVTQVEYSENFLVEVKDYISDRKFELYEESDDNPALKELHSNIFGVGVDIVSNCVIICFSSDSNYDETVSLFKNYIMDAPYVKFEQMEKEIFGEETVNIAVKKSGQIGKKVRG
ncbi:MAG: hypothetical protein FWD23_13690 [Oscillospiraceae bacterium]|nr:hypothetical protein [Oscillospiraceae bacterium]